MTRSTRSGTPKPFCSRVTPFPSVVPPTKRSSRPIPVNQILTVEQFRDTVRRFTAPPGFDFETNGQVVWHPSGRIVGASLAGPVDDGTLYAAYIPIAHQEGENCQHDVQAALAMYLDAEAVVPFYGHKDAQWA